MILQRTALLILMFTILSSLKLTNSQEVASTSDTDGVPKERGKN